MTLHKRPLPSLVGTATPSSTSRLGPELTSCVLAKIWAQANLTLPCLQLPQSQNWRIVLPPGPHPRMVTPSCNFPNFQIWTKWQSNMTPSLLYLHQNYNLWMTFTCSGLITKSKQYKRSMHYAPSKYSSPAEIFSN